MKSFTYQSGEEAKKGDCITYHGEPGEVEFVVTGKTGNPEIDWYAEKNPGGGLMINARNFGNVFLTETETDEDLAFVSRAK